jgi:hypothetical protein
MLRSEFSLDRCKQNLFSSIRGSSACVAEEKMEGWNLMIQKPIPVSRWKHYKRNQDILGKLNTESVLNKIIH